MSSPGGQSDDLSSEPARVRDQLDRILSSAEFQVPDRSRRFLAYIVDEGLAGRLENLKAYAIAQAVFGRDASFDAQNDPVVRIETGRIRRALERYYLVAGQGDPIQITIPKGGYVPSFISGQLDVGPETRSIRGDDEAVARQEKRRVAHRELLLPLGLLVVLFAVSVFALVRPIEGLFASLRPIFVATSPRRDELRPQIVVEPLVGIGRGDGDADIAKGLTDGIIVQLTKVNSIAVKTLGTEAPLAADQAQLFLQGSVETENGRLHVQIRLVDRADGAVVWTGAYDNNLREGGILDIQDEIARQVADAMSMRQ
ncbi:hypothetical protein [Rhizobium grahamii]|uniref:Uncharacterized protein n=1 Tax=Rhizobium grahamii CCGE 502 TaxID=990285 RepID=S3HF42_9HYPH|nr:hypothetical protein [Rhizobium grahamii]EPE97482.1 hypothetical protein RGCCGE502_15605 [Rhizobium grahamii CCGE 502]